MKKFTERKSKKTQWNTKTSLERAGKRQTVYNMIYKLHAMRVRSLVEEVEKVDIPSGELKLILKELEQKGLIYSPKPGVVGCVDD